MKTYFKLLRVKQWIKNTFLFIPMIFAQKLFSPECFWNTALGFLAFSFVASAIYILNDYLDREHDRQHPRKRTRPIASGAISPGKARLSMGVLVIFSGGVSLLLPWQFMVYALIYLVINIGYSFRLKHIPIVDIALVSVGYVLRIFAGAVICKIAVSEWLITMTFLLALFIALAKRRDDVLLYIEKGTKARSVLDGYNLSFLNSAMSIMASVIIVAYLLYTLSPEVQQKLHTGNLYLSVFFVILGIMRYLQLTLVEKNSGSPTDLVYEDRFLQIILILWLITIGVILYFL